ncbi:MAG: M67 family metallopeptidase [Bacteroidetes bacterium]|nr:M67 family metallopeptidase [Bacteroidota bacterium]MDA1121608.1 M67 family metallopeptidase [Bacteroidota bacterium]
MKLIINKDVLQEMTRHAEETFPDECVGFFYGKEGNDREIIVSREVSNSKDGDKRRRFEVDPFDYLQAEKFAEKNGLTLLGIYHSHPNHPAKPSEHDLKQAVPFFSYIIISVMEGTTDKITSWQLNIDTNEFEEEEININELDKV